jgi:hypothetical protein
LRSSRRQSQVDFTGLTNHQLLANQAIFQKPVESILVCTGVYNPQNDYLFQLRNLFDQSMNLKLHEDETNGGLTLTVPSSSAVKKELPKTNSAAELKQALSRRNSFINYFDNKLNIPDLTVPNLLDAVNYIMASNSLIKNF